MIVFFLVLFEKQVFEGFGSETPIRDFRYSGLLFFKCKNPYCNPAYRCGRQQCSFKELIECSIYLPNDSKSRSEISQAIKLFNQLQKREDEWDQIIILGDFNAWHVSWGDINNPRGTTLYNGLLKTEFLPLKLPAPTREGNKRQRDTYIDLVITNRTSNISSLKVQNKISDHFIVSCNLVLQYRASSTKSLNYRKTVSSGRINMIRQQIGVLSSDSLFANKSIDEMAVACTFAIKSIWNKNGFFTTRHTDPKPWFKPPLKWQKREFRY